MLRRLSGAAALCLLMASGPLHALGLGEIKVASGLNQRFVAVIPFTSLTPEEAGNVRARIAETEDFVRAGLERSAYLSSIQVETIAEGANPRIELRGRDLVREPMLTLLVEVRTAGGPRVLREYTVLLDPPVSTAVPPPAARPQTPAESAAAPSSEFFQTPEEVGSRRSQTIDGAASAPRAPSASPAVPTPQTYGPVRAGQTLRMVAQAVMPAGVAIEQAMLALYEANPRAFTNGDPNALRRGATLDVPPRQVMRSRSPAAARSRIAELTAPAAVAEPPAPAPAPREPVADRDAGSGASSDAAAEAAAPVAPVAPTVPGTDGAEADAGTPAPAAEVAPPADGVPAPAAETQSATDPTDTATATDTPTEEPVAPPAAPTTPPAGEERSAGSLADYLAYALAVLLALLVAIAVWRVVRERGAKREYDDASRRAAERPSAPRKYVDAAAAAAVPGDRPASAIDELEAIDRGLDETVVPDATPVAAAATPEPSSEADEQTVQAQFQANTQEIRLGDNDPLSEADFHLAYGLYDEAALLLQQASAREPERPELRLKLAETYFAAGRAAEFEQAAASLKDQVSADEWSRLAIMGRQIAPASPLFAAAAPDSPPLDLSFDEQAALVVEPPPTRVDDGLEFNLEELELPSVSAPSAQPAARTDALEFDLGEFDLGPAEAPKPAAEPHLDLEDFDVGELPSAPPAHRPSEVSFPETDPLVLDDPLGDEALSSGNDAATKLDLARAYVEMGDAEMARSLLDEVAQIGSGDQKREAGELRARLLG